MANKQNAKKWSQKNLDYFKELMLKKRKETIKEIERLERVIGHDRSGESKSNVESSYSYHMADVGTDSQEREKAFLWLSRENKFLGHISNAIDRINNGVYGICIECGDLIPKERLEEVPHTQHCFACKTKPK